jgi:hypothetical protein
MANQAAAQMEATAMSDGTVPPLNCAQPVPVAQSDPPQTDRFEAELIGYSLCVDDYLAQRNDIARVHQDIAARHIEAGIAALKRFNDFIEALDRERRE